MNINRHNYETFFLLYTDNELSVSEKNAVEEFVQTNPDLQEELSMLQQSILKPDNIVFDDKRNLLKNELIPGKVLEKLLLHLDNELPAAEANEIDGLLRTDAAIEIEWNILKKTKLSPGDAIVFKDKHSLYRKDAGRLITFPWWRLAVAAVFIGFGIWGGLVYFNTDVTLLPGEIAKNTKPATATETVTPAAQHTTTANVSPGAEEKEISMIPLIANKSAAKNIQQSPKKIAPGILTNRDIQTAAVIEKTNNLPKPYFDNVNNISSNNIITANVTPEKQPNIEVNPADNELRGNTETQDAANVYATTASFTDKGVDNNHILFMDEEKIKKTKLGGIFRKVKRVFERNTNIKTGGNNIKVANLEFAIQ